MKCWDYTVKTKLSMKKVLGIQESLKLIELLYWFAK